MYYIPNLYYNYGLFGTEELEKILSDILRKKNVSDDITFKQFFDVNGLDFIVTMANLNQQLTHFCNYQSTPNMSIKQACVISASFPLVFKSTLINGEYYCDGGTFANLPFKYSDEFEDESYGFLLNTNNIPINNLLDYIESLINGLSKNATDQYYIKNGKEDSGVINIDINDISTFCSLSNAEKLYLKQQGYICTKKYFDERSKNKI